MDSASRLARVGFLFLVTLAVAGQVQAQTDFSGEWAIRLHEDEPHRQAGPNAEVPGRHGIELGDYTGMPINAAARQFADSWDPSYLHRKLDEFAAGPWLKELRAATSLPLGRIEFSDGQPGVVDFKRVHAANTLGRVVAARANEQVVVAVAGNQ
jgi:hypothetical protein